MTPVSATKDFAYGYVSIALRVEDNTAMCANRSFLPSRDELDQHNTLHPLDSEKAGHSKTANADTRV